ncbi:hypothetical protein A2715_02655 [Candidatus Woesebacteria bacterium RIFCSPHIGHO2_01_FULL_39_32]|uniref:Four helix bundle protein n=1 Tax=Candidatus Woesebacteria bacterium RIFCSPLOWO2_01_FULL_39_25 TaxID=1802521 RepID=A0A1F8BK02_9BACT|nr:MAG: hypothetical protein A2124_01270 [Candidatus Woesebacteria bacterium GWB1_37_5]OGM24054.1 MAG: hypothetical protein A2715_02655 [Candidatus Woesebacteria bacterium RIFCSPHIGHO2_01_FULL_39_32]OGM38898.1 MAG: hypothetical protein A3F01_02405 [Candidatus Woesebacteria bacterium RIFCSPHIGHO2_12_FULL_38_11]OGM64397.1 MAG: hypothetical protein A2893_00830 [Candidatus Woesebacteria bacterium RIFCSPLOWO2_01_FULL_39_25]
MTNNNTQTSNKKYDLEERTLEFSKNGIRFCKGLPKNTINFNLINQLVRSSTSIGANYREANDSLGKKDFIHKLRIARKESKETIYWLELIIEANPDKTKIANDLLKESEELRNILSAIINKSV